MELGIFTFGPFQENTYILFDSSNECIIIDPGMSNEDEESQLVNFIETKNLTPTKLINTHCHIDHILGNRFVAKKYDLELYAHRGEGIVLEAGEMTSKMYGIPYKTSPKISQFLEPGGHVEFGNSKLKILFVPGHSPASVAFYHKETKVLIGGDVLFYGSIGRTDLPGGDFDTLINSIKTQFFPLPDNVQVYSGHGPVTTIGFEKSNNPFLV